MNNCLRTLLASSLLLAAQQANAILMTTQGDAPETDPALSTIVDDSGAGGSTIREISRFDVAEATGASVGVDITQTTQSNLFYIPLSFTLNRNTFGTGGLLEFNLRLSYASENTVVKDASNNTASATSGISDTTAGLSYYTVSSDLVTRTTLSVKFATGEFNDQLSTDSTDYAVGFFARKSLGRYAIKGNAGFVLRGEGPSGNDWGDSYILKAGAEYAASQPLLVGFDVTYTDTEESFGPFPLVGIATTDAAVYVDYLLGPSSGIYARVSAPIDEEIEDSLGGATTPDRDTTFSFGFSVRY